MERQKIFSLIETQTIISKTSLMVHWSYRRPQFFICWSSLLPAVVEGRKVRMQFLAGISSKSTTAKHPVWGGPPHLDRERTDSVTTLGYLTLALTGFTRSRWTFNVGWKWRGCQSLFHRGSGLRSRSFLWFLVFIFQDV